MNNINVNESVYPVNLSDFARTLGVSIPTLRTHWDKNIISPVLYSFDKFVLFDPIASARKLREFGRSQKIREAASRYLEIA